ncbi:hypothetical protein [Marilutibacter chinensis]|uniref:Uncharacterized protein n=1 Tax=Marilutibacter chinensis TaxID=2912247 RepID=A0ABS9HYJ7_9GAMM|nr:hypothetical protein [Lysobacter chinensis]MCF7223873.1 hypothetical protein [Lysobacter chinensis]
MTKITDPDFDQQLSLRQSFHVLLAFLEQFNSRSPQPTDDLLSWLSLESDGATSDPAQLDDFLQSAKSVLASSSR